MAGLIAALLSALVATAAVAAAEPFVVVLGVAQDAGYPQAGCAGTCCARAWDDPAQRRHVSCLAIVDPVSHQRWILDATPDFRTQLRMLDAIEPPASGTTPDLDGILLTHAHIGHYTGLVHLGHEVMGARGVPVYAMPRMREFLATSGPWDQLVRFRNIEVRPLEADVPVELNERVTVTPFLVPHRDEYSETVGYRIDGPGKSVLFIPDIDKWERWERRFEDLLAEVDAAFVDGTFHANGEIPHRDIAQIPHPFIVESMERFAPLPAAERAKIRFIHLNHTNPALRPDSDARRAIERAGFGVAEEWRPEMMTATMSAWGACVVALGVLAEPPPATQPTSRPAAAAAGNPAAKGFDTAGSDRRAIEIADGVMKKMGGRAAWDGTRYVSFSFFGRRHHAWDRHTGNIRLEGTTREGDRYLVLMNIHDLTGRAWQNDEPVTGDQLAARLKGGRSSWINDTYWLVMPYKLKDSGVTLTHVGARTTAEGRPAEVLELRFKDVGDTPNNKYHVYVGDESGLVEQWDFFRNADDETPGFTTAWNGWKKHGSIMLSADRGEMRGNRVQHTNVAVHETLPKSVFTSPEPTTLFGQEGGA